MSTKTLRKRIALVAVSAMGFGLLTSVAANATASASGGVVYASGTTGGFSTVVANSNSVCALNANSGANLSVGSARATTATSSTDLVSITLPVGGQLLLAAAANNDVVKVSGTGIVAVGDSTSSHTSTVAGGTVVTATSDAGYFTIKGLSAGTAYIKNYGAGTSVLTSIKVTVLASCAASAYDAGSSFAELQAVSGQEFGGTGAGYATANDNVDDVSGVINGKTLYLAIAAADAYGAALSSDTWSVAVSTGAVAGIADSGTPTCGGTATASVSSTGATLGVAVCQATANAPWSGTITVSYAGNVVVTKSATITGDIATIKVSSPKIGKTSASTYRTFTSAAYDSAGNLVASTPAAITTQYNQVVTAVIPAATVNTDTVTTGNGITCGVKGGTATVSIKATNAAGNTITSNTWTATCGGALDSFSATLDKSVYAPGDIATVTVTGIDADGKLVYGAAAAANTDTAATSTRYNLLSGTNAPVVTGGSLDAVVAPSTADYFSNGVKTYQFKVGATTGKYNLSVNLPDSGAAAVTVPYEIKAASASVTLEAVLAAIVKLIASINKQIATLQKSLKK